MEGKVDDVTYLDFNKAFRFWQRKKDMWIRLMNCKISGKLAKLSVPPEHLREATLISNPYD